jgi:hypothetical protein
MLALNYSMLLANDELDFRNSKASGFCGGERLLSRRGLCFDEEGDLARGKGEAGISRADAKQLAIEGIAVVAIGDFIGHFQVIGGRL